MSSESQCEQVNRWRSEHPGYYKSWTKDYRQWRDSEREAGRNVGGPSRPRTKDNKISYSITITQPLTMEERINHGQQEPVHHSGNKEPGNAHKRTAGHTRTDLPNMQARSWPTRELAPVR